MATALEAWYSGNFVFASSQTVYGAAVCDLNESMPLRSLECWYDFGKLCNEQQLQLTCRDGGRERGSGISLRIPLVFSPNDGRAGQDGQHIYNFLTYVYTFCRRNAVFMFDSDEGLNVYGSSFIGRSDLARAVVDSLALKTSGAYNVSGGFVTWRHLVETINEIAGTHATLAVGVPLESAQRCCCLPQSRTSLNPEAFDNAAGFAPRESLEELLEEFVSTEIDC